LRTEESAARSGSSLASFHARCVVLRPPSAAVNQDNPASRRWRNGGTYAAPRSRHDHGRAR
jgi:hypothetical protein